MGPGIGRCEAVDLPPIVPFNRPPKRPRRATYPLVKAEQNDRMNGMSDATRDTVQNAFRATAAWDWCVLFVRTVTAPQAVFWFLLWNVIRPRRRSS